ncbi:hypothetical protein QYZ88_004180 [Lachnospiraceae bacterium C1.1]|nr:hypothetical protein [Lachnospiraceae bacterium C1.1]
MKIRRNNPTLKSQSEVRSCPKCGAPLLSEICQYCGTYVGEVASLDLSSEYETVECKNVGLSFFGTIFPLFFGVAFLGTSLPFLAFISPDGNISDFAILIPFILVGLVSIIIFIKSICLSAIVNFRGEKKEGIVYGYMDDTIAYNNVNGQKVKLLVNTPSGKKFVIIPLKKTTKPYPVNGEVDLLLYKNCAKLLNKTVYKWS